MIAEEEDDFTIIKADLFNAWDDCNNYSTKIKESKHKKKSDTITDDKSLNNTKEIENKKQEYLRDHPEIC